MRSKAGQGAIPPEELIDSFTVVDLAVSYQISAAHRIYLSVDNLLDREYAANRGWLLDLILLFKTIPAVLLRKGAY